MHYVEQLPSSAMMANLSESRREKKYLKFSASTPEMERPPSYRGVPLSNLMEIR